MKRCVLVFCWIVFLAASPVFCQIPLGSEFQVNTYTPKFQTWSSVASAEDGSFVVVWESFGQDGSFYGIFGRRYDSAGMSVGGEFRVNTTTASSQRVPSVAMNDSGQFIVVWQHFNSDGTGPSINGRLYGSDGTPQMGEFPVSSNTADQQLVPSAVMDQNGGFVAVWQIQSRDGSGFGIFGREFDDKGNPKNGEFQVNTFTMFDQTYPSVAMTHDDSFVVVWESVSQDGSGAGIFGQQFATAGNPLGTEFQINSFTTDSQMSPSAASDGKGNFIVAWQSDTQDGDDLGIFGRRFDQTRAPIGPEFPINTHTTAAQRRPRLSVNEDGSFVAVWSSSGQDGDLDGIFAQQFDSSGAPHRGELQINTYTTSMQNFPSVTLSDDGNYVVTWSSFDQDGSQFGVFGQRLRNSAGNPSVQVAMDQSTYDPSQSATVSLDFVAGESPETVDVYLALSIGGSLLFVDAEGRMVGNVVPFAANKTVNDDEIIVVFDNVPLAGINPGDFTWFAAVTEPGTVELFSEISVFRFSIL